MKSSFAAVIMLLLMVVLGFANVVNIASSPEQHGPVIDKLRFKVVMYAWPPDAPLSKMLNGSTDVWTTLVSPASERDATMAEDDFLRESDIETLDHNWFTITSAPGYDVAYFSFNIRPDQSYKDPAFGSPEAGPVLSDVNFRHALFHAYNQMELCAPCWTIKPVRSLVPPAQCDWVNPTVPTHPYNPGDPLIQPGQPGFDPHSSCGILWSAGYTYSPGDNNWVTPYDLNNDTLLNDLIPEITVVTPTYERAPTSAEHGARWCTECNAIGVPVWHDPREFWPYLMKVFGEADFDICFVGMNVDRFPDFLYGLCHSSQDCHVYPWRYNAPGLCDPELDNLVETVRYSLDHDMKVAACQEIQERLCNESFDCAFAYLPAYSKECFGAYQEGLLGIVNTEGHGPDNMWTHLNMHWELGHPNERLEDGKTAVIWCLQDEPEILNPTCAGSVYAWTIMNPIFDPLIAVDPYSHEDVPWLAESWSLEEFTGTVTLDSENRYLGIPAEGTVEVTNGMNVTFNLNSTVEWHDGNPYTPSDAEFNLEFLRNNQIPRYTSMWQHVVDVQVINATAFVVVSNTTSQWLLYDYSGDAALLPPPVWAPLDGKPLNEILDYAPAANTTKPTGAGARFGTGTCPNQLYGTGPFIFDYYDPYAHYADMPANRYYFKSTAETQSQLVEMFHAIGDVNSDGEVWAMDKIRFGLAYGSVPGEPEWDPFADLNQDGIVDAGDGDLIGYNWGYKRTYPEPSGSAGSSSDYTERQSASSKSLDTLRSSSSTETTIYVDPPTVTDDALQAGSYFPVNMNVADVSNLRAWQANMSWNPSLLNVTQITKGDFLKGNPVATWYGKPYDYTVSEDRNASSCTPGDVAGWVNPELAFVDDDLYATCNLPDAEEIYGNYSFPIEIGALAELEVGVQQCLRVERDQLICTVSNDGGVTWGPMHTLNTTENARDLFVDVFGDFEWTPEMLSDANFKVKIMYQQVGPTANTIKVDWLRMYAEGTNLTGLWFQYNKTPTTWIGTWTDPENVTANDSDFTICSTPDAEEIYGSFGFDTAIMGNVTYLRVAVELLTAPWGPIELAVQVSNDGGSTWGSQHMVPVDESEERWWIDVTGDFEWTPEMLSDASFMVKVKYQQVGTTRDTIFLDWLVVRAQHVTGERTCVPALDGDVNSYMCFNYGERDANFTVLDFGHNFPSGWWHDDGEWSWIVQVDLYLRYSVNASALGDQYRIVYYTHRFLDPPMAVLLNWTSSEAPLDTYVWTNITDPDTSHPVWHWFDISDLKIAVETDSVGGDPNALFREYEAWIVVMYERPASFAYRINHDEGWCLFSETILGKYPGATGNGTLATVEFQVLEYGHSILNITHSRTRLFRLSCHPLIPQDIPHCTENGYFNNRIPGDIQGDTTGTPPDGDVDRYDFFAFSAAYLAHPGDPNWEPLADLQGDTTGSPPDGDVDRYDFFAFAANYGKHI